MPAQHTPKEHGGQVPPSAGKYMEEVKSRHQKIKKDEMNKIEKKKRTYTFIIMAKSIGKNQYNSVKRMSGSGNYKK